MDISQLSARPLDLGLGNGAVYLKEFVTEMASAGYTKLTICGYLDSAVHFGSWAHARGFNFENIDEETIKVFGTHHGQCPGHRSQKCLSQRYMARVERFADYLRQQGVIRAISKSTVENPPPLKAFCEWLVQHRGLALVTVERHAHLIARMLPALGPEARQYDVATVRTVILEQIRGCRPGYAKPFVAALRIYLRYLAASGVCKPVLITHYQPSRSGNSLRCQSTSIPAKLHSS